MGEESSQEESRKRIAFDCEDELAQSAALLAAHRGMRLAALAREALAQLVERASLLEVEAEVEPKKGDTLKDRKRKFVVAIEKRFYPILAARLCKVSLRDVNKWVEKDPDFATAVEEAQLYYACSLEIRQINQLRKTKGQRKDGYLFWQSFMNAHNPNHGRFKADAAGREFKAFIDEAYKIIERESTKSQATKTIDQIKKMAERRLARLGD